MVEINLLDPKYCNISINPYFFLKKQHKTSDLYGVRVTPYFFWIQMNTIILPIPDARRGTAPNEPIALFNL
jgi:hypothetical protein